MLRTRFTERFGVDYPIVSAPMAMHSGAPLAGAVSAAGGLGTFGAINPAGGAWVREQIAAVRAKTSRPFGAGFITPFIPALKENFQAALEERVPVVMFSFSEPEPYHSAAKAAGAMTICQVQTLEMARRAVELGADALVAQGNEAGGHTGTMPLLPLLSQVIEAYPDVPVLAAGGITSGRTLAAALAAGADGAVLGTAFLATPEAVEVSDAHKRRIVESDGSDTVYTEVFDILGIAPWPQGIAGRVWRNSLVKEWHGREHELRRRRDELRPALEESERRGDIDRTAVYYGQGAGAITSVRPVAEVLRSICDDAERLLRGLRQRLP